MFFKQHETKVHKNLTSFAQKFSEGSSPSWVDKWGLLNTTLSVHL